MKNKEYLASVGVTPSHENYARCLNILNSYGENRWWLSDDQKTRAYYQTEELVSSGMLLLPNTESYQLDLFALLGHPVFGIEFAQPRLNTLFQEVQAAMVELLTAQGHESEADALRQRLQETINPMIEGMRENIEKRGGIFFMSEDARKKLGRQ